MVQAKKAFTKMSDLKEIADYIINKNFNQALLDKFKAIQLSPVYKKKKSNYIIKNDFTKKSVEDGIKNILVKIS